MAGVVSGLSRSTLDDAEETLSTVIHKARLWQRINPNPVNERQRKVINRMLDDFKVYLTRRSTPSWRSAQMTQRFGTFASC